MPIILNTDDPALFECTLPGEYELARREFGFTEEEIEGLVKNSFSYAFADSSTFRRRSADFMNQLKKTKRHVALTVKRKAEAVVQDAAAY